MDLRHLSAEPTDAEREAIEAVLAGALLDAGEGEPRSLAWAVRHRHLLLPALQAAQARVGWVSPGALGHVCRRLEVAPAEGYGVATFYSMLSLEERPPLVAHVCDDIACRAMGSGALVAELERRLGPEGQCARGASATWVKSPCLGQCERAPAALLVAAGEKLVEGAWGGATAESVATALAERRVPEPAASVSPQPASASLRLLARVGRIDPASLEDYRASGGYRALRRAFELGPMGVVRELEGAKLVGRGGAAFPTARKWEAVAGAPMRPHFVVCNADESEPGTFKDRVLMEGDPFALVEALTVAGWATGSDKAFVYLRGEYPLAFARLSHAIEAARSGGLLGDDVLGRGVRFDIEIRRGAGAYVCGEETALMRSIEGRRGEPQTKPPFPVEIGLFGKPTCINNVETLANVLPILTLGAAEYRRLGTAESTGTRLFCVSGRIARPGVYELPFGVRLAELLALAGGVPEGRRATAVLLGGAAGTFVGPAAFELPLTFEDTRKLGATLGSGAVVVLDETVALAPLLAQIAAFFRHESCGQCVPCRIGTVRQHELALRALARKPLVSAEKERALLAELGQAMRDASICGLGQAATSALESAVRELGFLDGEQSR